MAIDITPGDLFYYLILFIAITSAGYLAELLQYTHYEQVIYSIHVSSLLMAGYLCGRTSRRRLLGRRLQIDRWVH